MADKEVEKSLEMRVAELEDKLRGLQVSEEEMRAYNKVSSMMASGQRAMAPAAQGTSIPAPDNCVVSQCVISQCIINQCVRPCTVVSQCTIVRQCWQPIIRACTMECVNECGGGLPGGGGFGGGFGGGGFGTLGG